MADVKISALPALSSAALTDLFAVVQGGVTYKGTLTQLVNAFTSTGLTATSGALTVNLSTGVAGGQSVIGGTAASNNLTLSSTSNATKGKILFGTSAYDEVNNRLGIGTASPGFWIEMVSESLSLSPVLGCTYYADSQPNAGGFQASKARGTLASPTQLLADDAIAGFFARGYHSGGAFGSNTSGIRFVASQNFTSTAQGTRIEFAVTTNGTTTRTERLRIWDTGNVTIQNGGVYNDAGYRLDVNGTARIQERLTVSQDNTVATQVVSVINTDTANCGMVIAPSGTGAIMANVPDGTATGGNARGSNAVDLQTERNNANQVASGPNCVIAGGRRNIASGTNYATVGGGDTNTASGGNSTVAGGVSNTASGTASTVAGGNSNSASGSTTAIGGGQSNSATVLYGTVSGGYQATAYLYGQRANASGRFAANADAQTSAITYRQSITGQAVTELFLDGASIRAVLPSNKAWRAQVDVVAIVQTVGNGTVTLGDCFMGSYHVGIKRIGANTSLVGAVDIANEVNDAGMAGAAVTITADDTNEALKIEFTPATNAGTTTVTRVVATAYLTEVGY